jgi:hypothetical protein
MLRCYALKHHDLDNRVTVDHRESDPEAAKKWIAEQAGGMKPGFLSCWSWSPQDGWYHEASYYRVTTTGLVRVAQTPLPEPDPLEALPGEKSALEFAPEDFPL